MILSMTGYGKSESHITRKKIVVEVRGLNSKSMDLNMRLPSWLRAQELEIRNLLIQKLERGKIDLSIIYQNTGIDTADSSESNEYTPINTSAFQFYYKELKQLCEQYQIPQGDIIASIMRIPDVLRQTEKEELAEDEWHIVLDTIKDAIEKFTSFRKQEGASLEAMFVEKLNAIMSLLSEVEQYEQSRIDKIKSRIETNLEQLSVQTQQAIDHNRLEQEMIYYLEKLDITEEKVRLTNHINYFRTTMQQSASDTTSGGVGKKLGFIAQEMGREINTLGSKSNNSEMQIIVVKMKDILEQIKEQVLNVL